MRSTSWFPSLMVCAAAVVPALGAQPNVAGRALVGLVRDSSGTPVEGAAVEIPGVATRTNSQGAFAMWTADIDTVTILIRRLGFSAVSALLTARNRQWDTVMVEMDRLPQRLAGISVKGAAAARRLGLRDLDARRRAGFGQFISRDEIAARNTSRPSDVVREQRGVRLVRLQGRYGVRFAAFSNTRPNCAPNLWIDGQLAPEAELDDFITTDIEAIELYENWTSTPPQFSQGMELPCGTIVVWSRTPEN